MPPAPKKVSAQPPPVWSVVSTLRAVVSQVQTASGIGDLVVWSVGAGGKLGQQCPFPGSVDTSDKLLWERAAISAAR